MKGLIKICEKLANRVKSSLLAAASVLFVAAGGFSPSFAAAKKCGTFLNVSIAKKKIARAQGEDGRPALAYSLRSPSGFFRVHYDLSGENAIDSVDKDANGVPDYADSAAIFFDRAYEVYVNQIGYKKPYSDGTKGGDSLYDVYLMDLGNGDVAIYGATLESDRVPGDFVFPRYSSYIIVDNNFSPLDSALNSRGEKERSYYTTGYDALKITAAHEFFHAIQFCYGKEELPQTSAINEMTSVWMEYRLYPNVKDYWQYVRSLFLRPEKYPFGDGRPDNGYRWGIFGQYVYFKYGDEIFLKLWENVGEGETAYKALDDAFKAKGSSLSKEWIDFLPWLYYTGYRAINGKYFADARFFPAFAAKEIRSYVSPATIFEGLSRSFEAILLRCAVPRDGKSSVDTLDAMIGNVDLNAAIAQYAGTKPYSLIYSDSPTENCREISGTPYYCAFKASKGAVEKKFFFTETSARDFAYPNPFFPLKDEKINLPVPKGTASGETVSVKILNSAGEIVWEKKTKATLSSAFRGEPKLDKSAVVLAGEIKNLSQGVYIYVVESDKSARVGKFAIRK